MVTTMKNNVLIHAIESDISERNVALTESQKTKAANAIQGAKLSRIHAAKSGSDISPATTESMVITHPDHQRPADSHSAAKTTQTQRKRCACYHPRKDKCAQMSAFAGLM